MAIVKSCAQYREDGAELIDHEKNVSHYQDALEIIDTYPWQKEVDSFNQYGEGDGLNFLLGDIHGKHAFYLLIPDENDKVLLTLEVIIKRGFLGVFGRQVVYKDFDFVSIDVAKKQIKELFNYSVDELYMRHKK